MADKITLHGQVMHPHSDRPWAEAHINWSFAGFTTTATTQRPTDRGTIIADLEGRWTKDFWVNEEGDRPSYYVFDFPPDRGLRVKLTKDLPAVCEFSLALLNGVSPDSPEYPSLIALIDSRLAGSGVSFPSGGNKSQNLVVVQESPRVLGWDGPASADLIPLNPAIPGLGGTAQSAIAALNNKPATGKLRELTDVNMGTQPNSGIPIYNSATQIFNLESQLDGGNF